MDRDQTSFRTPALNALASALSEIGNDGVRRRIIDNILNALDEVKRQERAACAHECERIHEERDDAARRRGGTPDEERLRGQAQGAEFCAVAIRERTSDRGDRP